MVDCKHCKGMGVMLYNPEKHNDKHYTTKYEEPWKVIVCPQCQGESYDDIDRKIPF